MLKAALQNLLEGGGEGSGKGLHDCLQRPQLLTANNLQLEILVTTLHLNWDLESLTANDRRQTQVVNFANQEITR